MADTKLATKLILKSLNPSKATEQKQIPDRVQRDCASAFAVQLVGLATSCR